MITTILDMMYTWMMVVVYVSIFGVLCSLPLQTTASWIVGAFLLAKLPGYDVLCYGTMCAMLYCVFKIGCILG